MPEHPAVIRVVQLCVAYLIGYAAYAVSLPVWLVYLPVLATVTVVLFVPPRS